MKTLYNGIKLKGTWPPNTMDPESREIMPVPYLKDKPSIIPIDVGRQLFVDDFLIEHTDLEHIYYGAENYARNPVLEAETEEELSRGATCYLGHGGTFFDPKDDLFKMFYTAGWRGGLAIAISKDAFHWERPDFGNGRGNILTPPGEDVAGHDNCVWLDLLTDDPKKRLKFMTQRGAYHTLHTSVDGFSWSEGVATGESGDYCSFFFNPFRSKWIYSIKRSKVHGRCRYYAEDEDFMNGAQRWDDAVYWVNTDYDDKPDAEIGFEPQLYSLNAVAYESLLVGMFYVFRGPENDVCEKGHFPKVIDLTVGFSRDGFHWYRPNREPFLKASRVDCSWNRGYLHSTAGVFLTLGDQLVFPYTGFSGITPGGERGMYNGGSVGIATLRRDGFASISANKTEGTLTTVPVTFTGKHLFVNVDSPKGELRVEVLDREGNTIETYAVTNCLPISTDSTLQQVSWEGIEDLSEIANRPVRFRFHLKNARLYSFWISCDSSGISNGYVAAGGPGFPGCKDESRTN